MRDLADGETGGRNIVAVFGLVDWGLEWMTEALKVVGRGGVSLEGTHLKYVSRKPAGDVQSRLVVEGSHACRAVERPG
jgi:hypothetical protein